MPMAALSFFLYDWSEGGRKMSKDKQDIQELLTLKSIAETLNECNDLK
jgi:hypothetical protein